MMTFNIKGMQEKSVEDMAIIINLIKHENPDVVFLSKNYSCYDKTLDSLLRNVYDYLTLGGSNNVYYFYNNVLDHIYRRFVERIFMQQFAV